MVMKRFNMVFAKDDGGIEVYPMKEWLRQHPDQVPPGMHATFSNSHGLRDGMRKLGWKVQETDTEVRLMKDTIPFDSDGQDDDGEDDAGSDHVSFKLEYQLRDFLAQNLHLVSVKDQRLNLYVDPTGRDGIEYHTPVGFIDILAVSESGGFFVFELKRASSPDHALGQLTRYMGWVKQTIGKECEVHGIIVAGSINDRLKYALSVVPNITLFEYQVKFRLLQAHGF